MAATYDREFYEDRFDATVYAARTITGLALGQLPPIASAADVGCGVGAWLAALQEQGVQQVHGFDGHWVDQDLLKIPADCFEVADLEQPIKAARRFDLAISLEVAEHVSAKNAGQFVDSLTGLADLVLFSAAIPMQGGVGHINEQPPQYWADLFAERGYVQFDTVRHLIWSDTKIATWYRQNTVLYVSQSRAGEITPPEEPGFQGAHLAHPESFEEKVQKFRTAQAELRRLGAPPKG